MTNPNPDEDMTIQEYVFTILEKTPHEKRDNSNARAELIESLSVEYLIYADKEKIEHHEYHFLSLIRVDRLLRDAQETYEDRTKNLFELGELSNDKEYRRELADKAGRYSVGNTYLALYSLAFETMKDLIERLVPKIVREDLDESVSKTLLSQVQNYNARADLLNQADIISDDTRDGIRRIGRVRRDLVHDVDERFFVTFLDDTDDFGYVTDTLNELYQLVYDEPIYVPIDETMI